MNFPTDAIQLISSIVNSAHPHTYCDNDVWHFIALTPCVWIHIWSLPTVLLLRCFLQMLTFDKLEWHSWLNRGPTVSFRSIKLHQIFPHNRNRSSKYARFFSSRSMKYSMNCSLVKMWKKITNLTMLKKVKQNSWILPFFPIHSKIGFLARVPCFHQISWKSLP